MKDIIIAVAPFDPEKPWHYMDFRKVGNPTFAPALTIKANSLHDVWMKSLTTARDGFLLVRVGSVG